MFFYLELTHKYTQCILKGIPPTPGGFPGNLPTYVINYEGW